MNDFRRTRRRVTAFANKRPLDAELELEMAAHIEMAIEENVARGMTGAEARRQAMIRFGGMELAKDRHRRREDL